MGFLEIHKVERSKLMMLENPQARWVSLEWDPSLINTAV